MSQNFDIAVLPGDGIGPEVINPAIRIIEAVSDGFQLNFEAMDAGAAHYERSGESIPADVLDRARAADAIFLGAMGLPHIRYADGTEIAPQLELRETLQLYGGIRPIRTFEGIPLPLASPQARNLDIVMVRESTEGLFAARGNGTLENDTVARDTMVISRDNSEKLFDFAFSLAARRKARGRPGRVTCIDKANVLGSMAFFRRIFSERAERFRDLEADFCYVDAAALKLVLQPWQFDVMVTENMFGDILSDLGAAIMGGMGMAPSADIGDEHAVFQPCHGSAPDIIGQGKANPIATVLSGALMLEWLGETHQQPQLSQAAQRIDNAVAVALAPGSLVPFELGGQAGTAEITDAIMRALESAPDTSGS